MTNYGLQIKKAEKTDFENSFKIINECAVVLKKQGMDNWERYTKEKVLDMIQSNEMFSLTEENKIVGTVKISQNPPSFYNTKDMQKWGNPNGKAIYFTALAVSPSSQGKGFGTLLIDFVEEFAKKENADYIRMTMFAKNKPLKNYYLNRGFHFRQQRNVQELDLELLFGEKKLD